MAAAAPNLDRFTGLAETYDAHRPTPPAVLLDILCQLAGVERPARVVDLGSGTGLSTRIWAERAADVIGIEPNADMRRIAHAQGGQPVVRFQEGISSRTGLPDACADIVTCSQALHWMEPEPTFAEVARILRPGGVFAAIDCDWPPVTHWEVDVAHAALLERVSQYEIEGKAGEVRRWQKHEHLARIRASGQFRYSREVLVHSQESGNADRMVGLALSQGSVGGLLQRGFTAEEIGLEAFRQAAERWVGADPIPWYFSYRVRIGIR